MNGMYRSVLGEPFEMPDFVRDAIDQQAATLQGEGEGDSEADPTLPNLMGAPLAGLQGACMTQAPRRDAYIALGEQCLPEDPGLMDRLRKSNRDAYVGRALSAPGVRVGITAGWE